MIHFLISSSSVCRLWALHWKFSWDFRTNCLSFDCGLAFGVMKRAKDGIVHTNGTTTHTRAHNIPTDIRVYNLTRNAKLSHTGAIWKILWYFDNYMQKSLFFSHSLAYFLFASSTRCQSENLVKSYSRSFFAWLIYLNWIKKIATC